jgi:hypothetical protein
MTINNADLRRMVDDLWAGGPQIKAMAAELLARREAEDWRDISTIPDDGPVLCGYMHRDGWYCLRFDEPKHAKMFGYTHWRPLPAPPEVKA